MFLLPSRVNTKRGSKRILELTLEMNMKYLKYQWPHHENFPNPINMKYIDSIFILSASYTIWGTLLSWLAYWSSWRVILSFLTSIHTYLWSYWTFPQVVSWLVTPKTNITTSYKLALMVLTILLANQVSTTTIYATQRYRDGRSIIEDMTGA